MINEETSNKTLHMEMQAAKVTAKGIQKLLYLSIEKCTSHPVEKCTIYFSNNFLVSLIL